MAIIALAASIKAVSTASLIPPPTLVKVGSQYVEIVASETLVRASEQHVEVVARETLVRVSEHEVSTVTLPVSAAIVVENYVEAVSLPVPSVVLIEQFVEVVWKEQATPDILPWRHNWDVEVREKREWKTDLAISRAEGSFKRALRYRPRRSLTIKFTVGSNSDMLGLIQWLSVNHGKECLIPLHHQRVTLASPVTPLSNELQTEENVEDSFINNLQPVETGMLLMSDAAAPVTDSFSNPVLFEGEVLIMDNTTGWQRVYAQALTTNSLALPKDKLARPANAGASMYPLIKGFIRQATKVAHHANKVGSVILDIDLVMPNLSYMDSWGEPSYQYRTLPIITSDYIGNDWGTDYDISTQNRVEVLDIAEAGLSMHRVNDSPAMTITRRIYAQGATAILELEKLMGYCMGRANPLWVDEQVEGLELAADGFIRDTQLIIDRNSLPSWNYYSGVILIRLPNGATYPVATAGMSSSGVYTDNTAVLHLAECLPVNVPIGTKITRLLRVTLDHDIVEYVYHLPDLIETNLRFRIDVNPVVPTTVTESGY
jgi:hypothetical protein